MSISENKESKHFYPATFHDKAFWVSVLIPPLKEIFQGSYITETNRKS